LEIWDEVDFDEMISEKTVKNNKNSKKKNQKLLILKKCMKFQFLISYLGAR